MTIKFENSSYLAIVKKNNDFIHEQQIFDHVKAQPGLKFNYGQVSYDKFRKSYSENGWVGRKIVALPAALWTGVVASIYHLSKAIFVRSFEALADDGKYFQVHSFHFARDLQKSFGWLITLYDDKYGQYHIQESGFNQSCYDCFLADADAHYSNFSLERDTVPAPFHPLSDLTNSEEESDFPLERATVPVPHHALLDSESSDDESDSDTEGPIAFNQREYKPSNGQEIASSVNLDEQVEEAKKISKTSKREQLLVHYAEAYLNREDREKALETIKTIHHMNDTKEAFKLKIATLYLNDGDLDKALEVIKMIHNDTMKKEAFIAKLATSYFQKGDLDQALEVIKIIYNDTWTKETFIAKIATFYFEKGDLVQALETIKLIYRETWTKETFIARLATSYFEKGNLDQARETIQLLYFDTNTKEAFFAQIASSYFEKGDLDQALVTIKLIYSDTKTKEVFIAKIATSYFEKGNLDKALATNQLNYGDTEKKDAFIAKIATSYLEKDNLDKALETIKELYNYQLKVVTLLQIAQAYFSANNESGVVKAIQEIVKDALREKMNKMKKIDTYYSILAKNIKNGQVNNFFADIAKVCYQQTKNYFSTQNTEEILKVIQQKANEDSTLAAFLRMKK